MLLLGPFLMNLSGTSAYLSIPIAEKDMILGASQGVSHNAWADAYNGDMLAFWEDQSERYSAGPVTLLLEDNDKFSPLRFHISTGHDYRSVEFPWLLLPVVFIGIGLIRLGSIRRGRIEA